MRLHDFLEYRARIQPESEFAAMGSERIRMRAFSKTTTAPAASASLTLGRFATRSATCARGTRGAPRRKRITDGAVSWRTARSVPKSVSAETTTRPSRAARSKITTSSASRSP